VPYTGGWLQRVTQREAEAPVGAANPIHGQEVGTDGREWTYRAPAAPEFDVDYITPGLEYVEGTPGLMLDHSSTDPAVGSTAEPRQSAVAAQAISGSAHAVDAGAAKASYYQEKALQGTDEVYFGEVFTGMERTNPGVPWVGFNSTPEANPEGYTPGTFRYWRAAKKLRATQAASQPKRYPMQKTIADATGMVNNIPAGTTNTTSPFPSLYRPITNYWQRPMIRQAAPPFDEAATVNGADEIYAEPLGSYGVY